jgi:hypothetical protein
VRVNGREIKRFTLAKNAYCVVEVPLRYRGQGPAPLTSAAGQAIHGERIDAQAGSFSRLDKTMGSSTHNIQTCKISGDAYCVIAIPLVGLSAPPK